MNEYSTIIGIYLFHIEVIVSYAEYITAKNSINNEHTKNNFKTNKSDKPAISKVQSYHCIKVKLQFIIIFINTHLCFYQGYIRAKENQLNRK